MDRSYIIENQKERVRLQSLINRLSDAELNLILYKEGWTISVTLAHLAFWDQRRLVLIRKWQQSGFKASPIDTDTFNDAMIPFLLAISPRRAAELAVSIAQQVDRELEKIPSELIEQIRNSGDPHALNRSMHRKMHLDDIEELLSSQCQK